MEKFNLKILYVEDHKELSISFYNFLSSFFKTVCLASNGFNAMKVFEKNSDFDLVITDLDMPLMDGLNLIDKIRDLDKNIPIYVTTAYDEEFYKHIKDIHEHRYFSKPLDIDDIFNTIKKDFKLNELVMFQN